MQSYLTAEISGSAIRHNLCLLRSRLAGGVKLCAVVKADCYGHGSDVLMGVICEHADALAVATPDEALGLRQLGVEMPILAFFSACGPGEGERHDALEELVRRSVTLTVVSVAEAKWVSQAAARVGTPAMVHVKIDSGMGRRGVPHHLAGELLRAVRQLPGVQLAGIYTHFATADEADTAPAREQGRRFLSAVDQAGGRDGLALHAANSAALLAIPQLHLDMVRPGLAIYGYDPRGQGPRADLRPALRLTARLMQVKQAAAGSSCGYGLSHRFDRDTLVGLVPVGYADGYMRCLSNKAIMRVRGADCPVRGRVSMDQTIIDLSAVAGAKVGDEVEIIGPDPAAPNSIENLARQAGTIPYEVLVRLGQRVHRTLVP